MKDKFMEIAQRTYGIFTSEVVSKELRGTTPDEIVSVINASMDVIDAMPRAKEIKRECIMEELEDNPKYREAMADIIVDDPELANLVTANYIARYIKVEDGEVSFKRRVSLGRIEPNFVSISCSSDAEVNNAENTREEIRKAVGYFRYDIPEKLKDI